MTPEETKRYIEHRLGERGWSVHIGKAGYDRIFRFTEGSEDGANEVCRKLLSFGALQESREINDEVVTLAMTDLAPARARRSEGGADPDLASIEQLTALLEKKVANGDIEADLQVAERPVRQEPKRASRRAERPKLLLIHRVPEKRAALAEALGKDFDVVPANAGEAAWHAAIEQMDVALLITDLDGPNGDGVDLIKRVRAPSAPSHLAGLPIIALAPREEADAKLRVLMAGANDFIPADLEPQEVRARALARYRSSKNAPRAAGVVSRNLEMPPAVAARAANPKPREAPPGNAPEQRPTPVSVAPIPPLVAEPRFAGGNRPRSRESLVTQLYRISSTTTITVSATVLLALAIAAIIYIGRNSEPASSASRSAAPTPESTVRESTAPETPRAETPPTAPPPATAQRPAEELPSAPAQVLPPPSPPDATTPAPRSVPVPAPRDASRPARAPTDTTTARPPAAVAPTPTPTEPPKRERAPAAAPGGGAPAVAAKPPAAPPQEAAPSEPPAAATAPPAPREEVAVAPPAASTPAPSAPAANRITRDELTGLLRRFASVYETGDLDQFLNLFAENARTNDRIGRRGIRDDYEALFRATDSRRMTLGEISWEIDGSQAYGWGDFEVTVKRANDQETYRYTGSLTFVVEKADGRLRIARLYHGQRRADSG